MNRLELVELKLFEAVLLLLKARHGADRASAALPTPVAAWASKQAELPLFPFQSSSYAKNTHLEVTCMVMLKAKTRDTLGALAVEAVESLLLYRRRGFAKSDFSSISVSDLWDALCGHCHMVERVANGQANTAWVPWGEG